MNSSSNGISKPDLALRLGRSRTMYAVKGLEGASMAYRLACVAHMERTGRGASTMPSGHVYDVSTGTPTLVAEVSWNGRVWPPGRWEPEMTPLYTPESSYGFLDARGNAP
jgi:hypothetical protein